MNNEHGHGHGHEQEQGDEHCSAEDAFTGVFVFVNAKNTTRMCAEGRGRGQEGKQGGGGVRVQACKRKEALTIVRGLL